MASRKTRSQREAEKLAKIQLGKDLKFELDGALRSAVTNAIYSAYDDIAPMMSRVLEPYRISGREFKNAHDKVGKMAQSSVLHSYDQRVTANEGPASRTHYRAGIGGPLNRYANGALRKALKSESMVRADETSLRFINWDTLDKEAKHWYRLNYGAGRRGANNKQGRYEVILEGVGILAANRIETLGLTTGPSRSGAPKLPEGFFTSPEGKSFPRAASRRGLDIFTPGRRPGRPPKVKKLTTAGIEARNFLDAGVRRIAKELPIAYDGIYRDALAKEQKITRAQVDYSVPTFRSRAKIVVKPVSVEKRFRKRQPLF